MTLHTQNAALWSQLNTTEQKRKCYCKTKLKCGIFLCPVSQCFYTEDNNLTTRQGSNSNKISTVLFSAASNIALLPPAFSSSQHRDHYWNADCSLLKHSPLVWKTDYKIKMFETTEIIMTCLMFWIRAQGCIELNRRGRGRGKKLIPQHSNASGTYSMKDVTCNK